MGSKPLQLQVGAFKSHMLVVEIEREDTNEQIRCCDMWQNRAVVGYCRPRTQSQNFPPGPRILVHVHVCELHVCACLCVYVCASLCEFLCVSVWVCMSLCMCVCMYLCECVCECVCVCDVLPCGTLCMCALTCVW